jgi:uncharacterized membrane protein
VDTRFPDNATLKNDGLHMLDGNWGLTIGTVLVATVLIVASASAAVIGSWIMFGPLTLGLSLYFLDLHRGKNPPLERLFDGFRPFINNMVASLLIGFYTFLGLLLLIVPGIIIAISYSQTFYILAEHPEMTAQEAMQASRRMMAGMKDQYFSLMCGFLGWFLLTAITCGVAWLYVGPYLIATQTRFYIELSRVRGAV